VEIKIGASLIAAAFQGMFCSFKLNWFEVIVSQPMGNVQLVKLDVWMAGTCQK
jgi:hypothetical protein